MDVSFEIRRGDRRRTLGLLLQGLAAVAVPAAFAAVPAASSAPAPAVPAAPELSDRMPAFWRVYDAARDRPAAERARALLDGFLVPEAALYRRAGQHTPDADRVARWLAAFDPIAAATRAVHAQLADGLQVHEARFRAALPDFDAAASPVFVLPSLFYFDAHLEPDGAVLPLFLAPDGIVRYHGAAPDLAVLFSHEIFHCYQAQRNAAIALDPHAPLHANLWSEGSATWASAQLNPEASLLHVLLDDEKLLREGPAAAPRAAAAMLDKLDATDDAAMEPFFSIGWRGDDWPARIGYYVGYFATQRLGLGLREVAGLPAAQMRERYAQALRAIRDGRPA